MAPKTYLLPIKDVLELTDPFDPEEILENLLEMRLISRFKVRPNFVEIVSPHEERWNMANLLEDAARTPLLGHKKKRAV